MSVTVGQQEFEKAVADFISVLKPDDKKALSASDPTAEDVANLVKQIDNTLRPKQKRRILRNSLFETLLVSIQQFYGVIDSCTQSNPEIASLVWGGMKFLILAFSNYVEYFEKIIGMCDEMGKLCPQYNRFAQLFPSHLELQSCIFEFYGVVVGFFKEASLFLYKSVLKQFAIAIFQPFRDKFNVILKSLGILKERIENEIRIAENQEAHVQRVRDAQNWATTENHFALARIAYHDFQEDRLKVSKHSRKELRNRILDNISSYSYYSDFANNLQKRLPNSGQWIFELPEYKAWVEPSQSAGIWYNAIPGFGKSVLTAGVIDNLIESSKSARNRLYVAYFFCTYTNASSLLAHTIIASLLRQLFYYSSDLPLDLAQSIESSFQDRISSARIDRSGLRELLTRILETNQAHNFIIIDGLDECNDVERGIVLRTLKELLDGATCPNSLKILVSSRGSQDIIRALINFKQVDLRTSNQQDIECFIEQAIKDKELEGQLPELPNDLFRKIKEFLSTNAKGLFIWVDLLILEICKESRTEDIEMALPTLPKDLDELYNRVLHRIGTLRKPEIARKIFRWVAYARRPLTLKELKEATLVEEPSISSWAALNRMTEMDEAKWLQNCENLVIMSKGDQTVRFAHSTVKDFLTSVKPNNVTFLINGECHLELARWCVRYFELPDITDPAINERRVLFQKQGVSASSFVPSALSSATQTLFRAYQYTTKTKIGTTKTGSSDLVKSSHQTLDMLQASTKKSFNQMLQSHPLLGYAISNWIHHYEARMHYDSGIYSSTNRIGDKEMIITKSEVYFDKIQLDDQISQIILRKYRIIRFPWQNYFSPETTTPLEDFSNLVDWALENKVGLIFEIIWREHKLTCERGWGFGQCCYHFSTYWFSGYPPRFWGASEYSRFQHLCKQNNTDPLIWRTVFEALKADRSYKKPLSDSTFLQNQPTLSDLLLTACKNSDEGLYQNLVEILRILPGGRGRSWPMGGISKGYRGSKYLHTEVYIEMVKASIDADCLPIFTSLQGDLYTEFVEECSPFERFDILRSTVRPGYKAYFKMLFQNRSYESALNFFYPTPAPGHTILQRAAWYGERYIVELMLLKQPLHLNVCGKELIQESPFKEYPIQLAAKANHLDVIKVMVPFLKSKVDVTISGNSNTALTYAIKNHNLEMVRLLLDAGADIKLGDANNLPKDPGDMLRNTSFTTPDYFNFPLLQLMRDPDEDILDLVIAKRRNDLLYTLEEFKMDYYYLTAYYSPWEVLSQGLIENCQTFKQGGKGPYWTMYDMIRHAIPITSPGNLPGSDNYISQEFLDFFSVH